jgi:hypothetical protein
MGPNDFDDELSRGELINFLGEFMSFNSNPDIIYRNRLCEIIVARISEEFGPEGLCELMMEIDRRANWISDIIFEQADFNNPMFEMHGVYDADVIDKARNSDALNELNKKIWRLRRRYAKLIVEEIIEDEKEIDELMKEDE